MPTDPPGSPRTPVLSSVPSDSPGRYTENRNLTGAPQNRLSRTSKGIQDVPFGLTGHYLWTDLGFERFDRGPKVLSSRERGPDDVTESEKGQIGVFTTLVYETGV